MTSKIKRKLKGKIVEHFESQVNFCEAIGERESTVSRIVRGRRELPAERRAIWAAVLKTPEKDLFV